MQTKKKTIRKKTTKKKSNLLVIVDLLKKEGFKTTGKEKDDILKDKAKDFLKNKYVDLYEQISEQRKAGKDLLIEELQLQNALAKQKIAIATNNPKDITTYLQKLKTIAKTVPKQQTS